MTSRRAASALAPFTLIFPMTVVESVSFVGGCNGNLKAIGKLVAGMPVNRVVELLQGNTCGPRSTSCADQLTLALREAAAEA